MNERTGQDRDPQHTRQVILAIAILLSLTSGINSCASSPTSSDSEVTDISTAMPSGTAQLSDYAQYIQEPFNRPSHYPLKPQPHPDDAYYHPVGEWTGRFILPKRSERQGQEFVWFEVQNAPDVYQDWIGMWAKLQWQDTPEIQAYVESVTTDVQFTADAWESQHIGRVHPTRLQGMTQVGPLESLAGARPVDDVIVMLRDPVVQTRDHSDIPTPETETPETDRTSGQSESRPILAIAHEPVQIAGRWHGLVQVLGSVDSAQHDVSPENDVGREQQASTIETSRRPEGGDRFWVRHFNKGTQRFDGPMETVHIPQVSATKGGIYPSTNDGIQDSPLNAEGWYIYGDRDAEGTFVVQALEPRQLMQLTPDHVLRNQQDGLDYIQQENWANVPRLKGTGSTALIAPGSQSSDDAIQTWSHVGDRTNSIHASSDRQASSEYQNDPPLLAPEDGSIVSSSRSIVLHTFGGIGGEKAEPRQLWTTTGHFSYGLADIIHDPLTEEPRFWIEYHQVYANNPNGIISGTIHWAEYMGNRQRGWLGTRPVSDVLIQLNAVTQPYVFGDIVIDPLDEFARQLSIMTARYRTGNGTGAAIVTPATSCVQDSNQALYATIQSIEQQVLSNPTIQTWLEEHPNHPQTSRFQDLVQLSEALEKQLTPLGSVRPDWDQNTNALSGITAQSGWVADRGILSALRSWRTLLPRRAHDELSKILLTRNGTLWFIRTNQIGGQDDTILPLAPTTLLGF